MKKRLIPTAMLASCLLLAACAPMTPAPTEDAGAPPAVPGPPPDRPEVEPEEPRIPAAPEQSRPLSGAAQSLLEQGWDHYHREDYQGALRLAERVQRMETRSPEVYLLMGSAQFGLYRLNLAEQLVRRGLAFSPSGSAVSRQLQTLLNQIHKASQ